MTTMEVWDASDGIFRTLGEVLSTLPDRALSSVWEVSDYVYPDGREDFFVGADGDDALERLANTGRRIAGPELTALAKTTSQVIWGTFSGYDPSETGSPWIRLHAIDSTYWRIETTDSQTRQAVMKSFQDVRLKE